MPALPPDHEPNPQRPPAQVADVPGSPLRAVLTGLVIDMGGSAVIAIVLGTLYVLQVSSPDITSEQLETALDQLPQSTIGVLIMVLGSLCSVAGGYACARIVQRDELRVGGVMAAISGLFSLLLAPDSQPADLMLLLTASTVACNLLGVKYGREHNLRRAQPAAPPADTPLP